MNPDIPVVVIGYNRPVALRRLLKSIAAADYTEDVMLYISLDGGGGEEVVNVAEDFEWRFGKKHIIRHDQNLGLREHVLSCGDLAGKHDALIVLEDDLLVSPRFYTFAIQAYSFFKDDPKLGGISLYHHAYNETAQFPFIPLTDGSDVFFIQYASSWGQLWTRGQWNSFREWYAKLDLKEKNSGSPLPPNIQLWPENSWKKYFIEYLIRNDLYFVYPRVSFTTIFGDEGTHIRIRETFLQVPLWHGERSFIFKTFNDSCAVYDTWCEILPNRLKRLRSDISENDFEVDLYGMKPSSAIQAQYVISGRPCRLPGKSFGREMKPHEANLLQNIPGDYFHLGKKEDFENLPYLIRLLKCHEKKELSYWYPIRDYHFYKKKLIMTEKKSSGLKDPGFIFRKMMTMINYTYRYFMRTK